MLPFGVSGTQLAEFGLLVFGVIGTAMLVVAIVGLFRDSQRWLSLSQGIVTGALALAGVVVLLSFGQFVVDRDQWNVGGPLSITSRGLDAWATVGVGFGDPEREAWMNDTFGDRVIGQASDTTVRVSERQPTAAQWAGAVVAVLGRFAAIVAVLWFLRAVLTRSLEGRVFDEVNVRALRRMAGAFVVAGPITAWLQDTVLRSLFDIPSNVAPIDGTVTLWPVLVAVLLLALAEVWRYGIALQREAEATV